MITLILSYILVGIDLLFLYDIFAGNELSYYCKYVDNKRMYLELAEDEIFTTKEEAEEYVMLSGAKGFVATAKVEWEE